MSISIVADNRKARFNYEILETLEAGMVLLGSEVKALRAGKANLGDGYVQLKGNEAFLISVHISPYENGGYANHLPLRARKLLLHEREMNKWRGKTAEKGLTIVPLKIYFKKGYAKCELGLVRGKKLHDKRETLRTKDLDREAKAAMKSRRGG
ncbi:MAG: SsrA-binding protein SmpB [Acidobacteria bacterium]|nr:SsrA-binding protein SmpB [Acidobacteriota bacterium]MCB9397520.1 SsrA-binding protein SmpB [Acidobacteriota bacterium]